MLSFVLSELVLVLDILLNRNSTERCCKVYLFQHKETEKPSHFTTVICNSEWSGARVMMMMTMALLLPEALHDSGTMAMVVTDDDDGEDG